MRLSKRQIADLRAECGKGGLDAALLAAQLLEMVEKLQASLDASEERVLVARRELARAETDLSELRLAMTDLLGQRCEACQELAARRTVGVLQRSAGTP
ncbi:MAG TPA: hypothetical protein VMG32_06550 [Anaeromyxobacteraceae bacterium]|nr:hypothetical protein [Anaeromyxobacteraceae bacterium]